MDALLKLWLVFCVAVSTQAADDQYYEGYLVIGAVEDGLVVVKSGGLNLTLPYTCIFGTSPYRAARIKSHDCCGKLNQIYSNVRRQCIELEGYKESGGVPSIDDVEKAMFPPSIEVRNESSVDGAKRNDGSTLTKISMIPSQSHIQRQVSKHTEKNGTNYDKETAAAGERLLTEVKCIKSTEELKKIANRDSLLVATVVLAVAIFVLIVCFLLLVLCGYFDDYETIYDETTPSGDNKEHKTTLNNVTSQNFKYQVVSYICTECSKKTSLTNRDDVEHVQDQRPSHKQRALAENRDEEIQHHCDETTASNTSQNREYASEEVASMKSGSGREMPAVNFSEIRIRDAKEVKLSLSGVRVSNPPTYRTVISRENLAAKNEEEHASEQGRSQRHEETEDQGSEPSPVVGPENQSEPVENLPKPTEDQSELSGDRSESSEDQTPKV